MKAGIVAVAGGLEIALRGAPVGGVRRDLTVAGVGSVVLPTVAPVDAHGPDGGLWRRHWSLPDRLVLEFVDGGPVVEVCDRDGAVTFDRELAPDVEEHLLLDHVLPLVLARRGALVMHGALVRTDQRGILLTGHTGAGKSTLTAFLAQRGWTIGGDDAAVVDLGPPLTAEPTYPTIRLTTEATTLLDLPEDVGVGIAGKRRLDLSSASTSVLPVPLGLVARLDPAPAGSQAAFTRLRGFESLDLLLSNAFHAEIGAGQRFADAVNGLACIADSVVVGDLTIPRGRDGMAAAQRVLEDALVS